MSAPPPATPPSESPQPTAQESAGWSAAAPAKAGPAAGLVYAGFWVRVLAFIIDAIALGILTSALAPIRGWDDVRSVDHPVRGRLRQQRP